LLACALAGEEVSVGVFTLFRPEAISVHDAPGGVLIEIPGRISRQFRGKLTMAGKTPVVTMDIETAVAAVMAAEMPEDAPPEALKALAVLARSFYLSAGRRHTGYDFCDTTHCQFQRESPPPRHAGSVAAAATQGIQIAYRGRPFAPMYSASCGGATLRAEEVGLSGDPYPYLAVACERCARSEPLWTRTLGRDQAGSLVRARSERERLRVVRELGWAALPGNHYVSRISGSNVVFTGRGQGHGVGFCQRGAIGLAAAGAGFREILRHYLPGTELLDRR
jgi:stage II sporulation protein D